MCAYVVCVYECVRVCVCVCLCERERENVCTYTTVLSGPQGSAPHTVNFTHSSSLTTSGPYTAFPDTRSLTWRHSTGVHWSPDFRPIHSAICWFSHSAGTAIFPAYSQWLPRSSTRLPWVRGKAFFPVSLSSEALCLIFSLGFWDLASCFGWLGRLSYPRKVRQVQGSFSRRGT